MSVDYNKISKKFSDSRIGMKWPEIDFFTEYIKRSDFLGKNILDIGCGNGRLIDSLIENKIITDSHQYTGIDLSKGLIEEAKKLHPKFNFLVGDMLEVDTLEKKFDIIFMIASFHHLDTSEKRLEFLRKISIILREGGHIYMTNWNLYSDVNRDKYINSRIGGSENLYGNFDFNIKFGEYLRYYHGFNIVELEALFLSANFKICENRIFKNERNIISIIGK